MRLPLSLQGTVCKGGGNTVWLKGKGKRGKVSITSDLLHKSAFCTLVVKGIHLYWGKGKYQTCTPFPLPLIPFRGPLPLFPTSLRSLSFTIYPLTFSQTTREVHTAYPKRIEGGGNPSTELFLFLGENKVSGLGIVTWRKFSCFHPLWFCKFRHQCK